MKSVSKSPIDTVIFEYEKCVMANFLDIKYDFSILRKSIKEANEKVKFFEYDDSYTDSEVLEMLIEKFDDSEDISC